MNKEQLEKLMTVHAILAGVLMNGFIQGKEKIKLDTGVLDIANKKISTLLKEERQEIIEMIRETLKDNNISPSDMNIKPVLNREQFITKIKTLTKQ